MFSEIFPHNLVSTSSPSSSKVLVVMTPPLLNQFIEISVTTKLHSVNSRFPNFKPNPITWSKLIQEPRKLKALFLKILNNFQTPEGQIYTACPVKLTTINFQTQEQENKQGNDPPTSKKENKNKKNHPATVKYERSFPTIKSPFRT